MSAAAMQGSSDKFVMEVRGRAMDGKLASSLNTGTLRRIANVLKPGQSNDYSFKIAIKLQISIVNHNSTRFDLHV